MRKKNLKKNQTQNGPCLLQCGSKSFQHTGVEDCGLFPGCSVFTQVVSPGMKPDKWVQTLRIPVTWNIDENTHPSTPAWLLWCPISTSLSAVLAEVTEILPKPHLKGTFTSTGLLCEHVVRRCVWLAALDPRMPCQSHHVFLAGLLGTRADIAGEDGLDVHVH